MIRAGEAAQRALEEMAEEYRGYMSMLTQEEVEDRRRARDEARRGAEDQRKEPRLPGYRGYRGAYRKRKH